MEPQAVLVPDGKPADEPSYAIGYDSAKGFMIEKRTNLETEVIAQGLTDLDVLGLARSAFEAADIWGLAEGLLTGDNIG